MRHPLPILARFAARHQRVVFAAALVLALASAFAASRLRFDTDVLGLLPKNEPAVNALRETLDEFGSLDYLLIAVRIPDGESADPYIDYVRILGERLMELESLVEVEYSLGELEQLLSEFIPHAVLFLSPEEVSEVVARTSPDRVQSRVAELRRQLAMPQSVALKSLLLLDPAGVGDIFMAQAKTSTAGMSIDWTSGYFLSRDQRMLLLLAKPERPPQDVDFSRAMVADVRQAIDDSRSEWRQWIEEDDAEVEVLLGGRYLIGLSDDKTIRKDFLINLATSLIGVLLLFLIAFRRFGPLAYAFVPLALGLLMTFGFSSVVYGRLSAATSGVAALLIGLGIDFIIVSYGRFVEERKRGADLYQALATMNGSSGRAVVIGAVTSAATFYSFLVTDFTGLRQMGILTGTGILLCMTTVLLLLPAMLAWHEEHDHRRKRRPKRYLHGFGSERLMEMAMRHPRAMLAGAMVVTLAALGLATQIRFDDSVQSMRPQGGEEVAFRDELSKRFGSSFEQMMLVFEGDTSQEVIAEVHRALPELRELVDGENLVDLDSLGSLIPPPDEQERALAMLEQARDGGLDAEAFEASFLRALEQQGMRAEPFADGVRLFAEALSRTSPLTMADFEASDNARRLIQRYVRQTDDGSWRSVVYLFPPSKIWRREPPPALAELADNLGPNVTLVGANVVSKVMRVGVLRDALVAAAVGFVLVAILLWFDFRRLADTLLSLIPLLIGVVWMVASMVLLGIPMNFMNIFVTAMIIGIGVDYGVHVIHRYREVERFGLERLEADVSETGKAITMAALSTIVGFGSLSLSHYPGLRSMGLVAILGALATCIVSLLVLPAYLSLRRERRRRTADHV